MILLLLAEAKDIHAPLPKFELALAPMFFQEYAQTALLADGDERHKESLFLCLHMNGLLQCINIGICHTISKIIIEEISIDRRREISSICVSHSQGENADRSLIQSLVTV